MQTTELRQALMARLGRFPERVPLAPTIGPASDMGAFTRALVTYEVEAGERIAAWLLTPHGESPSGGWPAVLAIHQHANQY
ncbi:MAG TPA: acyl-CoA thioester hydrolase, partial [Ktedonobacteraceae bacterium]|nr:acyl-CoA thioester hydrolase [Ktedonobacteraceae bacterium]